MPANLIPGILNLTLLGPVTVFVEFLWFWLGGAWWYEDIAAYQGVTYDNAPVMVNNNGDDDDQSSQPDPREGRSSWSDLF